MTLTKKGYRRATEEGMGELKLGLLGGGGGRGAAADGCFGEGDSA